MRNIQHAPAPSKKWHDLDNDRRTQEMGIRGKMGKRSHYTYLHSIEEAVGTGQRINADTRILTD